MNHKILPFLWLAWNPRFGLEYLRARREFQSSQLLSEEAMRELQWARLKKLIDHAYTRVPFYRRRFDETGIHPSRILTPDDFRKVPILTKQDVNNHLPELVAVNYDLVKLRLNATGGSTGNPMNF